jgi:predicted transcriptional regulator
VRKKLLPIAYEGLRNSGVDADEIEQYLGVIERRTRGVSGSKWISRNYRRLRRKAKLDDALTLVTQAIHQNQMEGKPVHEWKNVEHQDIGHWKLRKVNQIMTTELFTVNENDFAELVTKIMQWKDIHHIPVENNRGNLVGLLTWTNMLAYMKEGENGKLPAEPLTTVRDIMVREVITIQPSDSVSHARELMIRNQIGCLPVLKNDQLVGIITKHDLHDE